MGSIRGNGHDIDPENGALRRYGVGNVDIVAGFLRTVPRLQYVTRVAMGHTEIAIGQIVDVLGRVKVFDIGPHLLEQCHGRVKVPGVGGVRVLAQVHQGRAHALHFIVHHTDAAAGEL